jgi:hypothetical protein
MYDHSLTLSGRIVHAMGRVGQRFRHVPSSPVHRIQVWSIGIYDGPSPWQLAPVRTVHNPVLTRHSVTDVQASFVADPFMLEVRGTWHMFFEVMNRTTGRGEIGLATSPDGLRWTYGGIVLSEPFHLSYPYVFEWGGEYFMVPESHQAGAVRLYRARHFPSEWKYGGPLLEGPYLSDPSPFYAHGRWWMFVENGAGFKSDTLRLYSATALDGEWREHPASPLRSADPHLARPAGRVLVDDGRIIRFAQDCSPQYGMAVSALEVSDLSTETCHERALTAAPILAASGEGWNREGMHHVDAHRLPDGRWRACVDGWVWMDPRELR